ncbi:hypothetical protein ACFSR7_22740 [Cohnella sp. GCM10020058]|uniref:hypothetical protein n=1 Tax=Cohnella sp. GCM10020058 TaxID=3317330 RepID=UPI00363E9A7F
MEKPLYQKLYYKTGRALVYGAPEGFDLGVDVETEAEGRFDFVLVFVKNTEDVLKTLPKIIPLLQPDAVCWISYPKQSAKVVTDLNRDLLWRIMETRTDYRVVSNVAIDVVWSALRFRHVSKVKSTKP